MFDPKVAALSFGELGLRIRWFELAIGFGSPAWGKFRKEGLYEFYLHFGFVSFKRSWWRLRHSFRIGILCQNTPFQINTWIPPVHADFAVFGVHLGKGVWAEIYPLTFALTPRYHLSSSLGLRFEID